MPIATKQASAITAAQSLLAIATTLISMDQQLQSLLAEYTNEGYSAIWAAMTTAPLNADGSLGTADASPVNTHPITVGAIDRSQTQLVAMMTFAGDFHNFLNNAAVATANRIQNLNDMVG
jgi:hypothetical protein